MSQISSESARPRSVSPPEITASLRHFLSLDDFERAARRRLPRQIFGYVNGAAEDNHSAKDNRQVFEEYGFCPHVLVDVSNRNQHIKLYGHEYSSPFGIAPMGIAALSSYRGDIVLAKAAKRENIPSIMSGSSLIPLEEVIESAPDTWFQAYLPGDPKRIEALIARVARAGVETLVITVDIPVSANRENNVRSGFSTPLKPSFRLVWEGVSHPQWLFGNFLKTIIRHGMPHFENSFATRGAPILSKNVTRDFSARDHLNWTHLMQIRKQWRGNLIVKGILNLSDALQAKAHGCDGVILSNHGGRQLDGAISPLRILEQVVDSVGDYPVMIDSGFRRGSDVLKALALGARAVFVGRPFNYAAAVAGEDGVVHAIRLLHDEVDRNMAMLGVTACNQLNRSTLTSLR